MAFDSDEIYVIETHIDDMNPEIFGFLMELLQNAGALDVGYTPIQMKKNRPGVRLTVVSPVERLEELCRIILLESTASGVRYYPAKRFKLERTAEERITSLGVLKVKVLREGGHIVRVAPEYEDCRRLALEKGMPLLEVYGIVEREAGRTETGDKEPGRGD